jgi:uncharacterized phage protein gp47/JayE
MDVKLFDAINEDMRAELIASQDAVTDFNEGSVLASLLSATASEIEECYLRSDEGYKNNLVYQIYSLFGIKKRNGTYATASLIFSLQTERTNNVNIPTGTRVQTAENIIFTTNQDAVILAGSLSSNNIPAACTAIGSIGNVASNTITNMLDGIPYIDRVTNPNPATGGTNGESDIEIAQRFQELIKGLGGAEKSGILNAVKSIEGVVLAKIVEHFPPSEVYNMTIYVDDGSGSPSQELLDEVLKVVEGDGSQEYPGYRAAGVRCRVRPPAVKSIDLTIFVQYETLIMPEAMNNEIKETAVRYINNLEMGESLIISRFISECMLIGVNNLWIEGYNSGAVIAAAEQEVIRAANIIVRQEARL